MRDAGRRRDLLLAGAGGILAGSLPRMGSAAAGVACGAWAAWSRFEQTFLGEGDRVIDPASARAQTVSEGQAYALFFALVAGERGRFERILRWTEDHLAGGDLSLRLPAWRWGRRDDGSYGVLDPNSAADADLWLAYALGEGGRLWHERRYLALSSLLAERALREESAVLPGLGRTLLPGPQGFALEAQRWRLNPCYVPPFLLRWLAARSGDPRWAEMLASSLRLLRESAPRGLAPDWAWYRAGAARGGAFETAASAADRVGSYDAIRVYLWLGITSPQDPARASLLRQFAPMADLVEQRGVPPQAVDTDDGGVQGEGPPGFSAALLPFLEALGRDAAARVQAQRLQEHPVAADSYFGQVLCLFGLGWRERRYSMAADGSLLPAWQRCAA
jgi:endoglucanase